MKAWLSHNLPVSAVYRGATGRCTCASLWGVVHTVKHTHVPRNDPLCLAMTMNVHLNVLILIFMHIFF